MQINIKLLSNYAKIPTKAHIGDAGFDLYSSSPTNHWPTDTILPFEIRKIPIDIALEIPEGYFGLICDRSSLGMSGVKVMGGVIDSTYRGNVYVCLLNSSTEPYHIKHGSKVAQLLILPVPIVHFIEVNELTKTDREKKGFGSTNVF